MTDEGTTEAPALISVGASALKDNAERLGMKWLYRWATIEQSSPLMGTFDGDSEQVGMVSVVGPVVPGDRVAVVTVPPGVNVIIGWLTAVGLWREIGHSEEGGDSSTFTTETVIGTVSAYLTTDGVYRIGVSTHVVSTVAGDRANMRIREDSLTGTEIQQSILDLPNAGAFGNYFGAEARYTAVLTGDKSFVLTAQRSTGTGNLAREAAVTRPQLMYIVQVQ